MLFFGCEKEWVASEIEPTDKGINKEDSQFTFNQISFLELNGDENFNKAYLKVLATKVKGSLLSKESSFEIDAVSIKKINYGNSTTYTMFIRREENNENYFENLVLKVDSLKNVSAYIVKYMLNAPIEYYPEHESFSIDAKTEITRIRLEKSNESLVSRSTCIALYGTRCNGTLGNGCTGSWHTPGPNCQCVVIHQIGLDCSTEGIGAPGGGNVGGSGGSGGGSKNDPENGVVTAPNVAPYLWELKNFASGELNSTERIYYNSNGNIKNNIDRYLISKNFSSSSIMDIKLAIKVGLTLSLDYKMFNWAFNNNNNIMGRAFLYLANNQNSAQAIAFAKEGFTVTKNGGEVDFENEIIKDSSFIGIKADCVLKELISTGNNLFKKTSQAFTQNNSKYKIKFTTVNKPSESYNATASLPDLNGIITIAYNVGKYESAIETANTILHETIHAELHRIKLTNNSAPNTISTSQYNWYIEMWKRYEGIYDDIKRVATEAEHYYMSAYYINPLAKGLREYDKNIHHIDNYKHFAWYGLDTYGKDAKYITKDELTRLANLSVIVNSDSYSSNCDK